MFDFLLILVLALLGFLAHVAKTRRWLELTLRGVIILVALLEGISVFSASAELFFNPWISSVLSSAMLISLLILFKPIRRCFSWIFTGLNLLITGQILLPLIRKKLKASEYFAQHKVFVPSSIPPFNRLIHLYEYRCLFTYMH